MSRKELVGLGVGAAIVGALFYVLIKISTMSPGAKVSKFMEPILERPTTTEIAAGGLEKQVIEGGSTISAIIDTAKNAALSGGTTPAPTGIGGAQIGIAASQKLQPGLWNRWQRQMALKRKGVAVPTDRTLSDAELTKLEAGNPREIVPTPQQIGQADKAVELYNKRQMMMIARCINTKVNNGTRRDVSTALCYAEYPMI